MLSGLLRSIWKQTPNLSHHVHSMIQLCCSFGLEFFSKLEVKCTWKADGSVKPLLCLASYIIVLTSRCWAVLSFGTDETRSDCSIHQFRGCDLAVPCEYPASRLGLFMCIWAGPLKKKPAVACGPWDVVSHRSHWWGPLGVSSTTLIHHCLRGL